MLGKDPLLYLSQLYRSVAFSLLCIFLLLDKQDTDSGVLLFLGVERTGVKKPFCSNELVLGFFYSTVPCTVFLFASFQRHP